MMENKWPVRKLGDICEVLNGFAFKSDKYVDKGVRVIRITNVQHGYIEDNDPKFYPINECDRLHQYMLKENDLLMSLTGNVGRVGLLDGKYLPAALNQRVACLRIKSDNVELKYLFHHLNSELFETRCIQSAKGIAQKNMSTEWLKEYPIPIPPLSEQARIVEELDQLSNIIEKKRQQLNELDNLAQSIFYDMFGDPITNEKGWEVKKLGEIYEINPSKRKTLVGVKGDDIVSFLPMEDLSIKACYVTPKQNRKCDEVMSSYTCFADNDVLMAKVTPCFENGKVGIACNLINGVGFGSSEFIVIRPKGLAVREYVYHLVQTDNFVEKACRQFTGTSGLRRVPKQFVEQLQIGFPPLSLQQLFAQKIEAIEKEKELIKQSIKETEELFNSRMDYYFG